VYKSDNHMKNWLDGIRTRKPCVCTAEVGHRSVTVCHLGVIALRSGKKLQWDPEKMRATNAPEADQYIRRQRRLGWEL